MILFNHLVGLLAFSLTGPFELKFPGVPLNGTDKVNLAVALMTESFTGKVNASISEFYVGEINSNVLPVVKKSFLDRCGITKASQIVAFTVYFRVPLVAQGRTLPENIELQAVFEHLVKVKFDFRNLSNDNNLKFHEVIKHRNGTRHAYYNVTAPPGSMIPVCIRVESAKRRKWFNFRWLQSRNSGSQEPQVPQSQFMAKAKEQKIRPEKLDFPPPALTELVNPLGRALMSQNLNSKNIEEYAVFLQDKKYFMLVGYFQPRHATTKLVLSSKAPVQVNVHVPLLPGGNDKYLLYTLGAKTGLACELAVPMNPKLLYKVEIMGVHQPDDFYGFSLMVHSLKSSDITSPMELVIPVLQKQAQLRALPQVDQSGQVFDSLDFQSTPPSVTLESSASNEGIILEASGSVVSNLDTDKETGISATATKFYGFETSGPLEITQQWPNTTTTLGSGIH